MRNAEKALSFNVGDSVVVRRGTADPDFGIDLSGWQGKVLDIQTSEDGVATVHIEWDSIALKNMPGSAIEQCEERGLAWTEIVLAAEEVELTTFRDTEQDVARVAEELATEHAWSYLGEQGRRIRKVLAGVDADDEMAALGAWEDHLAENLTFPFAAEVDEFQEGGPLQAGDRVAVTNISLVDDLYGIIVDLSRGRRRYAFCLCDLEVADKNSPDHQIVEDYRTWFANR
jgi:hypothetical protein